MAARAASTGPSPVKPSVRASSPPLSPSPGPDSPSATEQASPTSPPIRPRASSVTIEPGAHVNRARRVQNEDLMRNWRARESNLLRAVSSSMLDTMKRVFDDAASPKGLNCTEFVNSLMKVFGAFAADKEDMCVQLLDLFSNIDVNGDRHLEWSELLNYVIHNVTATMAQQDGMLIPTGRAAAALTRTRYIYTAMSSGPGAATSAVNAGSDSGVADSLVNQLFNDIFDVLQPFTDPRTDDSCVLAFKRCSAHVDVLRWDVENYQPSLESVRRYRHGTALHSHAVLHSIFVPDGPMIVSCARQTEDDGMVASFFDFDSASALKRAVLDYPSVAIAYSASRHCVYFFASATGVVTSYDTHSLERVRSVQITDSPVHSCVSLTSYGLDVVLIGMANGEISVFDSRKFAVIKDMTALAHEFGVRAMAFSNANNRLVSIGKKHVTKLNFVTEDVYAVLVWDISAWITELQKRLSAYDAPTDASATGPATRTPSRASTAHTRAASGSSSRARSAASTSRIDAPAVVSVLPSVSSATTQTLSEATMDLDAHTQALRRLRALRSKRDVDEHDWKMRPLMLIGHTTPPTAITIADAPGQLPHVVSADESGIVIVWNMLTGEQIQRIRMAPTRADMEIALRHTLPDDAAVFRTTELPQAASDSAKRTDPPATARSQLLSAPHHTSDAAEAKKRLQAVSTAEAGVRRVTLPGIQSLVRYERATSSLSALRPRGVLSSLLRNAAVTQLQRVSHGVLSSRLTTTVGQGGGLQRRASAAALERRRSISTFIAENNAAGTEEYQNVQTHLLLHVLEATLDAVEYAGIGETPEELQMRRRSVEKLQPRTVKGAMHEAEERAPVAAAAPEAAAPTSSSPMGDRITSFARDAVARVTGDPLDNPAFSIDMRTALHLVLTHFFDRGSTAADPALALAHRTLYASGTTSLEAELQNTVSSINGILGLDVLEPLPNTAINALLACTSKVDARMDTKFVLVAAGAAIPRARAVALAFTSINNRGRGTSKRRDAHSGALQMDLDDVQMTSVGSALHRHGMALYAWTQAMPPREAVFAVSFLAPQLAFVSMTSHVITVWDCLTGVPLRVFPSRTVTGGIEFSAMQVDPRQRRLFVGDANGNLYVLNPVTGIVMKQLDPDPSMSAAPASGAMGARVTAAFGVMERQAEMQSMLDRKEAVAGIGLMGLSAPAGVQYIRYVEGMNEVVAVSNRGHMWACDDALLEGWAPEEGSSALSRVYPMPRALVYVSRSAARRRRGRPRRLPALVSTVQAALQAQSTPSSAEGAAAGASPLPKKQGDTTIPTKVMCLCVSSRLNLIAVCCSILTPQVAEEDDVPAGTSSRSSVQGSQGTGYALLVYDHHRATLAGACANHHTIGYGGVMLSQHTHSPPGSPARRPSPPPRSKVPAQQRKHAAPEPEETRVMDDIAQVAASDPTRLAAFLLPTATSMTFLDPLSALLSAHDDGSIRMWAVPPSEFPFTCRMYWTIPDAVTLIPPTLIGAIIDRIKTESVDTTAQRRRADMEASQSDYWRQVMEQQNREEAERAEAARARGTAGDDAEDVSMANVAEGGGGVYHRIPTALCAAAASIAAPMTMGTLAPVGHMRYTTLPYQLPPAPDTLEVGAHLLPPAQSAQVESASEAARDMYTYDGRVSHHALPCADKDGMVIWAGDSDGEIHRWYISPACLAAADLAISAPVRMDAARGSKAAVVINDLAMVTLTRSLAWSHRQAQARIAARRLARRARRFSMRRNSGDDEADTAADVVHECLPPVIDSMASYQHMRTTGQLSATMPTGVCWEGSWRAHGRADVNITSLQVLYDSGVAALLSGGNDGLSRVWDAEGRLLGSLDPLPKFWPKSAEGADKRPGSATGVDLDDDAARRVRARHFVRAAVKPSAGLDTDEPGTSDAAPTGAEEARARATRAIADVAMGPGHGSGRSFDHGSMTHVAKSRVYSVTDVPVSATMRQRVIARHGQVNMGTAPRRRMSVSGTTAITIFSTSVILSDDSAPLEAPERIKGVMDDLAAQQVALRRKEAERRRAEEARRLGLTGKRVELLPLDYDPLKDKSALPKYFVEGIVTAVRSVLLQRRVPGLRYTEVIEGAPPPEAIVWHMPWDLVARYDRQRTTAREMLATVKLYNLRKSSWWLRRKEMRQRAKADLVQEAAKPLRSPTLPPAYERQTRTSPTRSPQKHGAVSPGRMSPFRLHSSVSFAESELADAFNLPALSPRQQAVVLQESEADAGTLGMRSSMMTTWRLAEPPLPLHLSAPARSIDSNSLVSPMSSSMQHRILHADVAHTYTAAIESVVAPAEELLPSPREYMDEQQDRMLQLTQLLSRLQAKNASGDVPEWRKKLRANIRARSRLRKQGSSNIPPQQQTTASLEGGHGHASSTSSEAAVSVMDGTAASMSDDTDTTADDASVYGPPTTAREDALRFLRLAPGRTTLPTPRARHTAYVTLTARATASLAESQSAPPRKTSPSHVSKEERADAELETTLRHFSKEEELDADEATQRRIRAQVAKAAPKHVRRDRSGMLSELSSVDAGEAPPSGFSSRAATSAMPDRQTRFVHRLMLSVGVTPSRGLGTRASSPSHASTASPPPERRREM